MNVTADDIQIHGGVGFTWDCDAHFFYKRAKKNDILLGYQGWQRRRLADLVLDAAEAADGSRRSSSLQDAVAEHVRAGDALHLVGRAHALDGRGARGRAAVVGAGSRLHAGDAQPVEPRARCSSAAASCAR